jgi:hypothetical protein
MAVSGRQDRNDRGRVRGVEQDRTEDKDQPEDKGRAAPALKGRVTVSAVAKNPRRQVPAMTSAVTALRATRAMKPRNAGPKTRRRR